MVTVGKESLNKGLVNYPDSNKAIQVVIKSILRSATTLKVCTATAALIATINASKLKEVCLIQSV